MNTINKIVAAVSILAAASYIGQLTERVRNLEEKLGASDRMELTAPDALDHARRSVVRIIGGESEGSGFAIQDGGVILTSFHVIASDPYPKVILPDNTFETGRVVMADKDADLAVIKIGKDLPALRLSGLEGVRPAEEVLSVGFPMGGSLPGEASVTKGTFSRYVTDKNNGVIYLATDMTLVEGISGGPMVNSRGEAVGINTATLRTGGMAMAISSDTISEKLREMADSAEPLKDVRLIVYQPDKNPLEAVRAFYNYLKARKLEKAFELLSDNFVRGYSFEHWAAGYRPLLDTSIVLIRPDRTVPGRVNVKLATKDLVDDEIVYKYFEGHWDVRAVGGRWLLWQPGIREVKDPDEQWFVDMELVRQVNELARDCGDVFEYLPEMGRILNEPGNDQLSARELYERAKEITASAQAMSPQCWPR